MLESLNTSVNLVEGDYMHHSINKDPTLNPQAREPFKHTDLFINNYRLKDFLCVWAF